jgi:uncharacterized protein
MTYLPWWAGAIALAVVAIGYFLTVGRLLGVSGSVEAVLDGPDRATQQLAGASTQDLEAALLAATKEAFGDVPAPPTATAAARSLPSTARPLPFSGHVILILGIVAGGALGAFLGGGFATASGLGAEVVRVFGSGPGAWLALFGGGALVGFGTAMAGGCTSGHGLCGTSRLQIGSLLSTAAFFGTAIAVSFALARFVS